MSSERRFLVASSVARLIRREHPDFSRVVEGYFPPRSDRTQWVRVERDQSHLVLRTHEGGDTRDEQLEVPLSQAAALMDVAAGRIGYDRTAITLGPGIAGTLDRYILPTGLDLLTISSGTEPHSFVPPLWAGPDVTENPELDPVRLALHGLPALDAVPVQNAEIEALLDWLDRRTQLGLNSPASAVPQGPPQADVGAEDTGDRSTPSGGASHVRAATFRDQPSTSDDGVVRLARNLAPRRNAGT